MFNIGPGELAVILIAALILLGPERLPELARNLGKFLREFRRQTEDVRNLVEREFYKMDQDLEEEAHRPALPATAAVPDANGRLAPGPPPYAEPLPSTASEPEPAVVVPASSEPKPGES